MLQNLAAAAAARLGGWGLLDLDEDALPGAFLGGLDDRVVHAGGHVGQPFGAARVTEDLRALFHVGQAIVEQREDGGSDLLAQPVAGAQILIDPDLHGMVPSPLVNGIQSDGTDHRGPLSISTAPAGETWETYPSNGHHRCMVPRSEEEVVWVADSEYERRMAAYEREVAELQEQSKLLEEEIITLRRRLQEAPKRVRTLEEKLLETKGQLQQAVAQNEKLTYTLREAREHIAALRDEVDKLTQPPSAYGTLLSVNEDGTVDVFSAGRKMRVALHPELEDAKLVKGQEVVLNESLNVVLARSAEMAGEVVTLKETLDGDRALIVGRADEERVVELADSLLGVRIRAGDTLLM